MCCHSIYTYLCVAELLESYTSGGQLHDEFRTQKLNSALEAVFGYHQAFTVPIGREEQCDERKFVTKCLEMMVTCEDLEPVEDSKWLLGNWITKIKSNIPEIEILQSDKINEHDPLVTTTDEDQNALGVAIFETAKDNMFEYQGRRFARMTSSVDSKHYATKVFKDLDDPFYCFYHYVGVDAYLYKGYGSGASRIPKKLVLTKVGYRLDGDPTNVKVILQIYRYKCSTHPFTALEWNSTTHEV